MAEENEELSCEAGEFYEKIKGKERIGVLFVAKEFPATEPFLEAVGKAYGEGFFGKMEMAVIPVDSQECNALAEQEGVEVLPHTCVYSHGKRVGCVAPTDEDAKVGYRGTVEKLIDLSEAD